MNIYHKGTFHILRIQDEKTINNKDGLKIFGVRYAKFLPEGWTHLNGCTPPPDLLSFCKELEKENIYNPSKYPNVKITDESHNRLLEKPVWDEYTFKKIYVPNFIRFVNNPKAIKEINMIKEQLDNGQDVYYACYCSDVKKCHRRILAGLFQKEGYAIKNL